MKFNGTRKGNDTGQEKNIIEREELKKITGNTPD